MSELAPLLVSSFAYVFAGFVVGLVVGLTGVGGGSLMTPLLIFGFGIKPHLAIGTDLLFAAFTKLGGTVSLARHRLIDWRVVGQMALGSVPACLVTLYILKQLGPANPATQTIMTTTLGVALLLTAAATFYKAVRGKAVPTHIAPEHLGRATKVLRPDWHVQTIQNYDTVDRITSATDGLNNTRSYGYDPNGNSRGPSGGV